MPPAATRTLPVVLFDLDGTLIDSIELLVASMRHAFAARSAPAPDDATWMSFIGRTLAWQFSQFAAEDEVPALVQRYRDFQSVHHDRLTRPFDGVPELVARLHRAGHPLGVVTSKADHVAQRSIDHVGLAPYLDVVVGADSSTRHKPDPEPVHIALTRLGALPEQGVYVGDSPFDILAGNAAGVVTIGVTWGVSARSPLLEATPTFVASSVGELDEILSELRVRVAT